MFKIEILEGENLKDLQNKVNGFIEPLKADDIKGIDIREGTIVAIIQYEIEEEWRNAKCMDCSQWDDEGKTDTVSGLCHIHGRRTRFNCRACKEFKDIRGVER